VRYQLVSCEIIFREAAMQAALSPHIVDVTFLTKGLHDNPDSLREQTQAAVDAVEEATHDAVLLGYGICSHGLAGVRARGLPLVIPRAHDCITLFLGSKETYARLHHERPGTYYYTAGWIERNAAHTDRKPSQGAGLDAGFAELVAKYGEDNARYLMEFRSSWVRNYTHACYIQMPLSDRPEVEAEARRSAEEHGWEYVTVPGDDRLVRQLLTGEWDDADFLTVPPGHVIVPTYDSRVLAAAPLEEVAQPHAQSASG